MPAPIFIIDSSPAVRRMVEQISFPQGCEVIGFQDGPAALEAARRMAPALIIVDYHLADMTFSGFCKEVTKLEHLAETILVSLVDASDRFDEPLLRSLGVRAFLKKPLQTDQLMDAIKGLKKGSVQTSPVTPALKKRAWPPDSVATDLAGGAEASEEIAWDSSPDRELPAKEEPFMRPLSAIPTAGAAAAPMTIKPAFPEATEGEEAIRGLLNCLLRTAVQQAEEKISELVPLVVAKELAPHVTKAVREEVRSQLADALSADRIEAAVRGTIMNEVSKQAASQVPVLETTMRQRVEEIVPPLVNQTSEKLIRQLLEGGLEKYVPPAVREHLGPVDLVVKEEVHRAVAGCARQTTEEIVREMARERIQEAVQLILPDIAEARVREEIKRLTAAE